MEKSKSNFRDRGSWVGAFLEISNNGLLLFEERLVRDRRFFLARDRTENVLLPTERFFHIYIWSSDSTPTVS